MKKSLLLIIVLFGGLASFSQENEKALEKAKNQSQEYVFSGNKLLGKDQFVSAEMEYRKAISEQPTNSVGAYNLGTSYYQKGNFNEALYRNQQALKSAVSKKEKHYVYHNIGNILMQEKKCKEAAEAFKNALKNDPTDDETRYNFALAKKCAEDQQEQNQDNQDNKDKQDKQDENQDKDQKDQDNKGEQDQDQKDKNQKDKEDKGEQDKDGEQKEDKKQDQDQQKPDEKEGNQDQKKQPQQQPGQLSPQQVKNLLEAMNAQEQKTQEKINAEKQKGVRIQTEKDW